MTTTTRETMKITNITPARKYFPSHRTGTLKDITVREIIALLGFKPNFEDDPYKVENSWTANVTVKGSKRKVQIAIWDYRGSHLWNEFSTYGPHEVLRAIFGDHYVAY